jgi:transposase InsO family protein
VDLTKLPRSVSGNEYIAVFIDACTRWPEAVAIPDKKATTVVCVMKEHIFARHGIPAILLSDEGSECFNTSVRKRVNFTELQTFFQLLIIAVDTAW